MRLRDLFMILLLCMTVGIFSACTGDDGEAGPPGPQGPPGEDGEDGDASTREYSYPFLVNWGAPSGKLACDSSLLMDEAAFPGPESLTSFTKPQRALTSNGMEEVKCSDAGLYFTEFGYDADGDGAKDVDTDGDEVSYEGLLFIKTGRGMMPPASVNSSPDLDTPTRATTTAYFSGGTVVGKMVMTGSWLEPVDRRDLWRECEVGTTPSMIKGDWRAVKKVTKTAERLTGATGAFTDGATSTTTLRKLCVRLDSLPGVVKCYVRTTVTGTSNADGTEVTTGMTITGQTVGSTEVVGIYENEDITPTMPAPRAAGDEKGTLKPNDATPPLTAENGVDFVDTDPTGATGVPDFQEMKICNLFNEVGQGLAAE